MNWLYPLTIVYVCLLAVAFLVFRKRLLSPSVIFLGSFTAMLTCCSVFNWYFKFNIKPETFGIMSFAAVVFLVTELCYASCLRARRRKVCLKQHDGPDEQEGPQPILLRKALLNGLIIFMLICIGLALVNLFMQVEGRNWHEMMSHYNHLRKFTHGAATWRFTAIGQLFNLVIGLVYVNVYILVYNKVMCGVPLLQQKRGLCITLLFVPFSLIATSGRQPTVELAVYSFLLSVLLLQLGGGKIRIKKLFFATGAALAIFFVLFQLSATYVGRIYRDRDIFGYIGEYLCGGLTNFNDSVGKSFLTTYWGENTFANVYAFFAKFGLIPEQAIKTFHAYGWRGNYVTSTTVTTYGRWYEDFGALGVYIMTAAMALLFSYLFYSKVLTKTRPGVLPIIYLRFGMALVWASYDDRFFVLLAVGNLIKIFWMVVFCRWLVYGKGKILNLTAKVRIVGSRSQLCR